MTSYQFETFVRALPVSESNGVNSLNVPTGVSVFVFFLPPNNTTFEVLQENQENVCVITQKWLSVKCGPCQMCHLDQKGELIECSTCRVNDSELMKHIYLRLAYIVYSASV